MTNNDLPENLFSPTDFELNQNQLFFDQSELIESSLFTSNPTNISGTEIIDLVNKSWKVLIVDDEKDIHTVVRLALDDFRFLNKQIEFLDAYSAAEARKILEQNNDIALIFLDVVMETDNAGLELVNYVRSQVKNQHVQIVLQTGYPGIAPEKEVIVNYEIDNYHVKTEFTADKLIAVVLASLRTYRTIMLSDTYTRKLEEKVLLRTKELELQKSELLHVNEKLYNEIQERISAENMLRESKKQMRAVVEASIDAILLIDRDTNIKLFNPAAEELFQYMVEEVENQPYSILLPDRENYLNHPFNLDWLLQNSNGKVYNSQNRYESIFRRRDGSTFIGEMAIAGARSSGDFFIVAAIHDITKQKSSNYKLIESENLLRQTFENLSIGFCLTECIPSENSDLPDFKLIKVNPAFERMLGKNENQIKNYYNKNTLKPGGLAVFTNLLNKISQTGSFSTELWSEEMNRNVRVHAFCPSNLHFAALVEDITETKKLQNSLIDSEKRLDSIVKNAPFGILCCDRDKKIYNINQQLAYIFGFHSVNELQYELQNLNIDNVFIQTSSNQPFKITEVSPNKDLQKVEFYYQRKDNTVLTGYLYVHALTLESVNTSLIVCYVENNSERKKLFKYLIETEQIHKQLLEISVHPIIIVNNQAVIIEWNDCIAQETGVTKEEVYGKYVFDILYNKCNCLNTKEIEFLKDLTNINAVSKPEIIKFSVELEATKNNSKTWLAEMHPFETKFNRFYTIVLKYN